MDVRLPDGTIVSGVPDGMSKADLTAKLKANGYDVAALETAQSSAQSPAAKAPSASYMSGAGAKPALRDSLAQLQGPTFGFLDEAAGGIVGGLKSLFNDKPLAQNYQEVRDYVRGATDAGMKANPVRNMAGQMALSAPIGAIGAAKAGAGPVMQYLSSVGLGGLTGAVSGAGNSTEQTASGIAGDALKSGLMAAAMPGVLLPAAKVAAPVVNNALSRLSDSKAADYARQKVAEAFLRDNPLSSASMSQAGARLNKLGPEARLADSGGTTVRATLDTLATLPGATKNATETAIKSRQSTRADRMIGAAEDAMGTGGIRMAGTMEEWMAQRSKDAAPLYSKLHKMDVPVDQDLAQIVDIAQRNGLGSLAKKIADYDRVPFTLTDGASTTGKYAARDLDYIKRAMDSQIPKLRDPQTGAATAEGRALIGLRDALVSRMDGATGGFYAKARDAWAGPSQLMDAATAGKQILNKDDATIKTIMGGMGASEKDAFALGAFEALRAKLGTRAGQTQMTELWREKGMQEKLKAIFGDERAYREFASRVAAEGRMKGLESVGRGSQTAARQYAAGDLDVSAGLAAGGAIADAKSGNIMGLISKGAQAWNRVATPEPVRDAMGRILLSQGLDARSQLLAMQAAAQEVARRRAANASALGLGAGAGTGAFNALSNALQQDFVQPKNALLH